MKDCWLSRPGHASTFTPKEGRAQECKTSEELTMARIIALYGSVKLLSTSNRRAPPLDASDDGII